MNIFALLAVLMLVVWIVAKVMFAITSVFLHLLWVVALVFFAIWIVGKIFNK
ncbi:MAG: hypothetical protein ABIP97_12050 [Chthoniobacterales bacterium]